MPKTTDQERLEKFKKVGVDPKTPGLWEEKWQNGDHDRFIMRHKVTGEERKIEYSEKDKQIIRNGDTLQPFQKDAFIKRYGNLPGEDQKEVDKYILRHSIKFSDMPAKTRNEVRKRYF